MNMYDEDDLKHRKNIAGQLEKQLLRYEPFIKATKEYREELGIPDNGFMNGSNVLAYKKTKLSSNQAKELWNQAIADLIAIAGKSTGWTFTMEQFLLTGRLYAPLQRAKVINEIRFTRNGSVSTKRVELIDERISADEVKKVFAQDRQARLDSGTEFLPKQKQLHAYDHYADTMLLDLHKRGFSMAKILELANQRLDKKITDVWELSTRIHDAKERIDKDKI